jgi:hypothetical protein
MNVFSLISNFKKDGISVLKELSKVEYTELLSAYYNASPLITDCEYDMTGRETLWHCFYKKRGNGWPRVVQQDGGDYWI